MKQPGSPQQRAFQWLQSVDSLTQQSLRRRRLGLVSLDPDRDLQSPAISDARIIQRYRLMAFYYGANGDMWMKKASFGSPTKSECDWDDKADELFLKLECEDVDGTGDTTLVELSLLSNRVSGVLVPELGEMTGLRNLIIDNTNEVGNRDVNFPGLTGGLPDTLSKLTKMSKFKIFGNSFTAPIAGNLFVNWKEVTSINLAHNGLPGPLPAASLTALKSCTQFIVGNNKFTGPIPAEIGAMSSISLLSLSHNELTGDLPPQLANLSQLRTLQLNNNKLTGLLPDLSKLTLLKAKLDLSNNQFIGPIPNSIVALKELQELSVANNKLTGPIPDLSPLGSLKVLELMGNAGLTGKVPPSVCDGIEKGSGTGSVTCQVDGRNAQCPSNPTQLVCCSCCTCPQY